MSTYLQEVLSKWREKDIDREIQNYALVRKAKATTGFKPKLQKRYFLISALGLMLLFGLFFVSTTHAQIVATLTPPVVPENLKASAGEVPTVKISARGVQIYRCTANLTDASKYKWTLKAPEAELFNEQGITFGKHYAGPTWEATDGSKVVGEVKERTASPDRNSIAWLLLKAKETTKGDGLFSNISSIQRIETVGGIAPSADTCDQTGKDKHEARVEYTAVYYFYRTPATANPTSLTAPATGLGGTQTGQNSSDYTGIIALGLGMLVSLGSLLGVSLSK